MTSNDQPVSPALCPLCAGANGCRLCTLEIYKGPCWCEKIKIPDELISRIPEEALNKACLCQECVMAFHREKGNIPPQKLLPGDFYFENGLMVFTAQYHLRRGYCCESGCRYCPYSK